MNPEEVVALIEAAGGVLGAVNKVADEFNKLVGKVDDVKKKVRWLKITIVNMSPTQSLLVDDSWFDSGRFWEQPFFRIHPGSALTFYVCDHDGSIMCGVTGGVGLSAYDKAESKFTEGSSTQWVCTFSNPFAGSYKCSTRWKDFGIKPLFDRMNDDTMVRDSRCGCYRTNDNEMVYIWKDPTNNW
jgi:hypothetical protein